MTVEPQNLVLALAREFRDGDRLHIGAGQNVVTAAAELARVAFGHRLRITVAGTRVLDPHRALPQGALAFDLPTVRGADIAFDQDRYFDDIRRLPIVCSTAFQVDAEGNGNMLGIRQVDGDRVRWPLRGPGCVGIPSLTGHAKRLLLYLPEHSLRTLVPTVDLISMVGSPRRRRRYGLPADPSGAVITPLATFRWDTYGLYLAEYESSTTIEELQAATGFTLRRTDSAEPRAPQTAAEAAALLDDTLPVRADQTTKKNGKEETDDRPSHL